MFASQLLRILESFPTNVNNEICNFDTDEVKEKNSMKESPKRYTNPFLSDEENEKVNLWNINNNNQSQSQEVYTDKNVMELELECELPELLVCYNEGAFHVKDICVDDGIPHGEKILFDEDKHDDDDDDDDDVINETLHSHYYLEESNHVLDIGDISLEDLQISDKDKVCDDDDDAKDCVINSKGDDNNHVISESAPEELKSPESDNFAPEDEQMDDKDKDKDRSLPSLKSLLESINGVHDKDEDTCQNCVEGNEVSTSVEETTIISNQTNGKTVISNGLHDVHEGESSFSVAGPVSGRINYSGQIAFSGSISLRSDSSTTSTRSFAFPILQTEWNSSPVRMAKADRRRLQKHRGWRNGILCCRF